MSMYNMVLGNNPLAAPILELLGAKPQDFARFRDAYFQEDDGGRITAHVFTRLGGGNRDEYALEIASMQAHPDYVDDYDDEFDSTYMTFVFDVDQDKARALISALEEAMDNVGLTDEQKQEFTYPSDFKERFKKALDRLKRTDDKRGDSTSPETTDDT